MQWMEMHQVGFGECVVLGGRKKEILMIDCGSLRGRLDDGTLFSDYTRQISERYGRAKTAHLSADPFSQRPLRRTSSSIGAKSLLFWSDLSAELSFR